MNHRGYILILNNALMFSLFHCNGKRYVCRASQAKISQQPQSHHCGAAKRTPLTHRSCDALWWKVLCCRRCVQPHPAVQPYIHAYHVRQNGTVYKYFRCSSSSSRNRRRHRIPTRSKFRGCCCAGHWAQWDFERWARKALVEVVDLASVVGFLLEVIEIASIVARLSVVARLGLKEPTWWSSKLVTN